MSNALTIADTAVSKPGGRSAVSLSAAATAAWKSGRKRIQNAIAATPQISQVHATTSMMGRTQRLAWIDPIPVQTNSAPMTR